jgi:hypothetical protein
MRPLRQAHAALLAGQPAEAGEVFETIADEAAGLGMPSAAALSVEAGLAWILAAQIGRGVALAERGLGWLQEGGGGARLPILRDRVVEALKQSGHGTEAAAFAQKYAALPMAASPASTPPARRDLPASCPQCGGRVRPDEVEWVDDATAVCDYCGSVLKTGGV